MEMTLRNFMLKENKEDWLSRKLGLNIRGNPKIVIYLLYVLLTLWLILLLTIYL